MIEPLIIDSFAGGGGASTGIEMALGRSPDIAINHNAAALALHEANHPETLHLSENVYKVDPLDYLRRKHIGLAWFSPDCKHFSKAKGGKPVERNVRDLAWIIPGWVERIQKSGGKVDVVILENVEEFQDWGPLVETDRGLMPDPAARGQTFLKWCKAIRRLGGKIECRELRACDYGAPTIRKRFFAIIRFDKLPIVWPKPSHGKPDDADVIAGRKLPWRMSAEVIDWTLPCPSIFDSGAEIMEKHGLRANRPLAEATMNRVARGVDRYVLKSRKPFLVNLTHGARLESIDEPFNTITGAHRGEKAIVAPSVIRFNAGATGHDVREPLATVTANSFKKRQGGAAPLGLVAPVLSYAQQGGANRSVEDPAHTITASTKDQNAIIAPYLVPRYGEREGQAPRTLPADAPMPTIVPTSNQGSLAAVYLAQNNTGVVGHHPEEPLSTIVQKGCTQSVIAASLVSLKGSDRRDSPIDAPHPTVLAGGGHSALLMPFISKYYGVEQESGLDEPLHTTTAKARFGYIEADVSLPPFTEAQEARARQVADFMRAHGHWDEREFVTVEIGGEVYTIVDIGMRMLKPRELFSAQGFPPDYKIEIEFNGKPLPMSSQIECCGNSVSPPMAKALVAANCNHLIRYQEAAE
ncbi:MULTISPECIES: DNA cytosine methyltransferase [unclassified Mesorhizobium]|uniref:DNA cytosine methyltransferase n=1 Tax=unclassified Mesorhizobium TaxID=325217 RepID=UPI000BB07009|nr:MULTISPECIES: DNA cytosine methyltransferase [unclassified Mesorhizobium]PBC23496.1 C-5 cytosine-specific DNA methylase [Mesorhizobium sp. WSM4311]TRD06862.1 C-5 cytosine-specific DNA methylase [Mesorhizobium sp. WSM4305]